MSNMNQKWEKPTIEHGKMTKYNYIVQYPENLDLGKNFDIGEFTYINSNFGVKISDNVQIGFTLFYLFKFHNRFKTW